MGIIGQRAGPAIQAWKKQLDNEREANVVYRGTTKRKKRYQSEAS
jgi:hypothetical protein